MRHTRLLLAGLLLSTALAAKCFSITDPFVVSVNVDDVTGVYDVDPNTVSFDPSCTTKNPEDYIDQNYELESGGGRLVDITVQTVGTFAGDVVGGEATINGTTLVTYSGAWSTFSTPRSILTASSPLVRNPAGVSALLSAIQNGQPITICHDGAFSEPTPDGLSIVVKVYAQVSVKP
jgi:hypothetical protein